MRGKDIVCVSVAVVLLVLTFGVGRLSAAEPLAPSGGLDSPGPPSSTTSYTLEDIYNRLDVGTAGSQSTFTEPSSGPTAGTGHTLDEIMAKAPAEDDINAAAPTQVLASKTYWSLHTGSTWGTQTGTMPNRGQVIYTPGTSNQTVAGGYHDGTGYVAGDADLVADNIKDGVEIFDVTGTYASGAPANPAPVPRTGQTISYTVGDDGDLEKGIAWPNPRFTDNSNGTITDNLTGLIWLKDANCWVTERTWASASTLVNGLAEGMCGLLDGSSAGDWRLPNVRELQSLIHYGVYNPALPNTAGTGKWTEGDPFTDVQWSFYWSSTTYASGTSFAWYVHMTYGSVGSSGKSTSTYYVWPVRGGQ